MKLKTSQIIFTAVFVATVVTAVNSFVNWDKQVYAVIFAGISVILGGIIAKIIFKDRN